MQLHKANAPRFLKSNRSTPNKLRVQNFNVLPSPNRRIMEQKQRNGRAKQNPRSLQSIPYKHSLQFFSANQETFTKVDHILRHKTWSQQIQENGKSLLLSDHKWNKVRSQSQRNYKNLQLWKYSILFSDEQITDQIKSKIPNQQNRKKIQ